MTPLLLCMGANHKTASIELRESFYIEPDVIAEHLEYLKSTYHFSEIFILSTCNRFEIIAVSHGVIDNQHDYLINAWLDLQSRSKKLISCTSNLVREKTYCYSNHAAIQHIFRVASSLDSLIPGETQITGQFKTAIQLATKASTLGPVLSRLAQESIAAAKKVRSQTDIGKRTVSISHAAVSLAKRMYEELSSCRFLIIGTGEMGRLATEYAHSYKPKNLYIANRTVETAETLAAQYSKDAASGLDQIPTLLRHVDIVIVATSTSNYIISEEMIKNLRRSDGSQNPLFLVDIGMPRNIDPKCREYDDVYLFDIDDLKQVIDQNMDDRKVAASQGEDIVMQGAQIFTQWLSTLEHVPVMEAWKEHIQATLQRESLKTFSKEIFSNLNSEQKQSIEQMLLSVTTKLTGDLAQSLRTASSDEASVLAQSVGKIFGLNDPKNRNKEHLS